MSTSRRGRIAAALAVALLLTSCGDDDTEPAATTTDAPGEDPAETTNTTATTDTSATGPQDTVIEVSVTGGEVTGDGRHEVEQGERVTLRITSDTDDEVHLHGYDLTADLPAGIATDLTFDATIPGVFEAELHDAHISLLELQVS